MVLKVLPPTKKVDDVPVERITCHSVDSKISSQQVIFQGCTKAYFWLTCVRVITLGTKRSDLENIAAVMKAHSAKMLAHQDNRTGLRWRYQAFDFIRTCIGCQVRIVRLFAVKQHIAYRSTYHIELFMLCVKCFRQRHDDI